ncbi:Rv3235 family protein [Tomitella gaofuii]|uniref:Rv3235 family protein n=1 Tax=Tomitella gaofuii TaxID=2760083 RepID=UPI0015F8A1DD|nr:Rv3235 family protein [Tomitella gaofuii]
MPSCAHNISVDNITVDDVTVDDTPAGSPGARRADAHPPTPAPTDRPRLASLHNPPFVEYRSVPVLDATMRYLSRPPDRRVPAADAPQSVTTPSPAPARRPTRTRAPRTQDAAAAVEVRRRVEVTLRLVLEVLDLRRRPEHLEGFADTAVLGMVRKLARTSPPGRQLGSAVLRRIHIASAGPGAAEICATYVRGRRTLAIAGRFERKRGAWVCTALHLA